MGVRCTCLISTHSTICHQILKLFPIYRNCVVRVYCKLIFYLTFIIYYGMTLSLGNNHSDLPWYSITESKAQFLEFSMRSSWYSNTMVASSLLASNIHLQFIFLKGDSCQCLSVTYMLVKGSSSSRVKK